MGCSNQLPLYLDVDVFEIEQFDLGSRRHKRPRDSIAKAEHDRNHLLLVSFNHAGRVRLGDERLDFLIGDRALGFGRLMIQNIVDTSSSQTSGAAIRESADIKGATRQAMASAFRSARFFGRSSPMTTEKYGRLSTSDVSATAVTTAAPSFARTVPTRPVIKSASQMLYSRLACFHALLQR